MTHSCDVQPLSPSKTCTAALSPLCPRHLSLPPALSGHHTRTVWEYHLLSLYEAALSHVLLSTAGLLCTSASLCDSSHLYQLCPLNAALSVQRVTTGPRLLAYLELGFETGSSD